VSHAPPGVIVRASAGTGKTHTLAVRCIELLAEGESLDSILATTFTRKAAGEIRARILSVLAEADAGCDKPLDMLREAIPGFDRARARELLVHTASRLHRMQIMTIDALSAWMASMIGLEIGLSPGWSVIDDLADQDFRMRALDLVLARSGMQAMLPVLHDLHAGALKASIHRTVVELVGAGERAWRACEGDAGPWDTIPESAGRLTGDALASAVRALADTPCTVTKSNGEPDARWAKAHAGAIELARDGKWEEFLGAKVVAASAEGGAYYKIPMPVGMRAAYISVRAHAAATVVDRHRVRARAMYALIARFLPEYESLKEDAGRVRFEDVPRMLRRADASDFGSVYFRMDTRFRHILLDEFQDTSADQFALLAPMIDEIVAGSEERRSVLIVGDPKQSLYSWRNAAPGLMDAVDRRWPGRFAHRSLTMSWRSSPVVLDAVNTVFGSIGTNPVVAGLASARAMERMFTAHSARHADLPGEVTIREIGEPRARSEEEADAPAWVLAAADLVEQIRAQMPGATIGVLTRSGKAAGRIIGVLRGRTIPASAERGTPLGDTPAIAAFASVLTVIDHPGHSQAAFHASQTPVGRALGLTDHRDHRRMCREISHLRRSIFAEGVAPMCLRVMRACAPDMDHRSMRRFEQLVEVCEAFDRDPSIRLDMLTRQIWTVPVEDPSASKIRVMTIHAAKGLEFDAVILPELFGQWSVKPGDVLMDQPDPVAPPVAVSPYANAIVRSVCPELEAMYGATRERRIMDELCALYVGMTRARTRLELIVPPEKESSEDADAGTSITSAAVIRSAFAHEPPSGREGIVWQNKMEAKAEAGGEELVAENAPRPAVAPPRFLVRTGARSVWRSERTTPSGGGEHRVDRFADRAALAGAGASGELMHGWFARLRWIEDGIPARDAMEAVAQHTSVDARRIESAIAQFQNAVAHPEISSALSRLTAESREPGGRVEVRTELPFLVRVRGALVSGRMDRITIGWQGDSVSWIEILDYKTDAHDPADAEWVARRVEAHRAQMEAYRSAASEMFGIDAARIRIGLVFTSLPAVAWVGPARR